MAGNLSDLTEQYNGEAFRPASVCPICAGASKIAHPAINMHPEKTYRFNLRICIACGHGWIDPMPSQGLLTYLYGQASRSVIGVEWTETGQSLTTAPQRLVVTKELSQGAKPRRYFELGLGKGFLYSKFVSGGWETNGVEPGAWGKTFPGVFRSLDEVPNSMVADVIVALDVLEHISDPVAALVKLRQFAAVGAKFYAAMPNRESIRAKIGREKWRMLRPLGHVNYWSRRSIEIAFARSGFRIEELRKTDLWEPRPITSLRIAAAAAIEHLGLGDQWIAVARAI